mmetsp:Transcript_7773/g.12056  ORF Transcript_7773/g.12056 Transcript_7773/m.12056 type:complete len:87 (-) Transcript_7773:504-764(-)|eukprot:CAMPEP_0170510302 /NCGR_PEP_ID=MMETSP0208-20121228/65690_1 /TAXON_ID=197538 /ORGANISM="Strombidium inclinatum, Strain S3" /LENGTH=86 /DNA_ID=CAMNT_0010793753 /DNA_START=1147 /DNA_END=1407 /DNA_ORIENTATION=-
MQHLMCRPSSLHWAVRNIVNDIGFAGASQQQLDAVIQDLKQEVNYNYSSENEPILQAFSNESLTSMPVRAVLKLAKDMMGSDCSLT